MQTRVYGFGDIPEAAQALRDGELVAVPTETVYGLCCNGLNTKAVHEIYELKGRPEVKPLSLMLHSFEQAERYCKDIPAAAYALAAKYLPGPLTIILPARENVPEIVRAGGATVGIRCPQHELTLKLLEELDMPLAGPSANPSGEPSPKSAEEVLGYFSGKISGVLDGGVCAVGVESTVIDMSSAPYRILRSGALTESELHRTLTESLTVFGITGGTGGGKTTALNVVKNLGGLIIDCDEVYHELLEHDEHMIAEIAARFPAAMGESGIVRKALGKIVFADASALLDLNAITHKYILSETDRRLQGWALSGGTLAAIDAIALIESKISEKCTTVLGITAPREVRLQRLMSREGISREYALSRIDAQQPDKFFEDNCDYILENNGTLEQFQEKCRTIITALSGR